jgi:hypothetical protein
MLAIVYARVLHLIENIIDLLRNGKIWLSENSSLNHDKVPKKATKSYI